MITGSELSHTGWGRSSSVTSSAAPTMPGSEYSHSRLMPVLNLSCVVMTASTTLGSRL